MRGRVWLCLGLVALGAAVVASASAFPRQAKQTTTFAGDTYRDGTRVALTVKVRHGRPVGGTFEATDVYVACEGIPLDDRATFPPVHIRFADRDTFIADRYDDGSSSGVESYVHVKGNVNLKDGRAAGIFIGFLNPADPAQPECGTRNATGWKATR